MGAKKISYVVCVRNVKERDSSEALSVDGKKMKITLKKLDRMA